MAPVSTLPNQTRPTMPCATCHLPILVEPWIVEHVNPGNVFCSAHQPRSTVDPATVATARRRMAADQAAARRARYRAAVRDHDPRGGYDTATVARTRPPARLRRHAWQPQQPATGPANQRPWCSAGRSAPGKPEPRSP